MMEYGLRQKWMLLSYMAACERNTTYRQNTCIELLFPVLQLH